MPVHPDVPHDMMVAHARQLDVVTRSEPPRVPQSLWSGDRLLIAALLFGSILLVVFYWLFARDGMELAPGKWPLERQRYST
jgi:hypothetical protein